MTIALGILASDGMVLAADSEITTPYNLKAADTKILGAVLDPRGGRPVVKVMALAGAGSPGHYEAVRFKVVEVVMKGLSVDDDSLVEQGITRTITEFYHDHIIPFYGQGFPEPPDIELLAAMWNGTRGLLWATDRTAVRRAFDYDAVGIARLQARELLSAYFTPMMSVESAVLLACYIIMRVKGSVQYCGQETQIIVLRSGVSKHLPRAIVKACEGAFERYADFQTVAFRYATGVNQDPDAAMSCLSSVHDDFKNLIQGIKATTSSMDQT